MATTNDFIQKAGQDFDKSVLHLKAEYSKLQIGRANPTLVEDIKVEAYGTLQPLKTVATIAIPEPRTISIQPWDKSNLATIERAVHAAGLGLTPINNGVAVLINMPALTEERRGELVKVVKRLAEECKISVRNARQTAHSAFKELESNKQASEDDRTRAEKLLQEKVDAVNKQIDEMAKSKEQDIMRV